MRFPTSLAPFVDESDLTLIPSNIRPSSTRSREDFTSGWLTSTKLDDVELMYYVALFLQHCKRLLELVFRDVQAVLGTRANVEECLGCNFSLENCCSI